MPVDSYEEDDDPKSGEGVNRRFREFDCPSCNANNPCGDTLGDKDEVLCNYCGSEYRAQVNDEGKLRLREI